MFDSNSRVHNVNTFSYDINAVSGALRKSHPKSKFCVKTISQDSHVFNDSMPKLALYQPEIVILQLMLAGENQCIIEYVLKTDFESNM